MRIEDGMRDLGAVKMGASQGVAWPYEADMVSIDQVSASSQALRLATFATNAPIYFRSQTVGYVHNLRWCQRDGRLAVFFRYDDGLDIWDDVVALIAVPKLAAMGIGCIRCNRFFKFGSAPCDCINTAPVVLVTKVHIVAVTLYESMHDGSIVDSRSSLIARHFGGAVAALDLLDDGE